MNKSFGLHSAEIASSIVKKGVKKRRQNNNRLKFFGRLAVGLAVSFLFFLFFSIFSKGIPGFFQYYVSIEIYFDRERLDPKSDLSAESLYNGDAREMVNEALYKIINPKGRSEKKSAKKIISSAADQRLIKLILNNPKILNTTQTVEFALDDDVDSFLRGYIKKETPEKDRRINDKVIKFIETLENQNKILYKFSDYILSGSASRSPEIAGIKGALIGSILTLIVCFLILP